MKNKKVIYGIEFSKITESKCHYEFMCEGFCIFFFEFKNEKSELYISFQYPTTTFRVERNTIEQTFLDFFNLCPNLEIKEFDDLKRTFFDNYGKETAIQC